MFDSLSVLMNQLRKNEKKGYPLFWLILWVSFFYFFLFPEIRNANRVLISLTIRLVSYPAFTTKMTELSYFKINFAFEYIIGMILIF